jgi:branched-chain amino acid transport system permease protein
MLSQSLNLSAGFGGMISLAHAGFYGVGAYSAALLAVNYQMPFLLVLPVAMLLCGLLALLVSAIALRTIDDYFIICTLGIQVIVFSLMNNWMSLTRGPLGIPGIPDISLFGMAITSKWSFLLLTLFFVLLVLLFLRGLTGSSFGRTLRSLSEDEIFTQSLGKNVYLSKVIAANMRQIIYGGILILMMFRYSKGFIQIDGRKWRLTPQSRSNKCKNSHKVVPQL